ncbi:MAG: hypothetical protein Q8K89_11020 [Actinomycetota bacterium]|nr:hypothetical protein [Actinomycetota bacterium]
MKRLRLWLLPSCIALLITVIGASMGGCHSDRRVVTVVPRQSSYSTSGLWIDEHGVSYVETTEVPVSLTATQAAVVLAKSQLGAAIPSPREMDTTIPRNSDPRVFVLPLAAPSWSDREPDSIELIETGEYLVLVDERPSSRAFAMRPDATTRTWSVTGVPLLPDEILAVLRRSKSPEDAKVLIPTADSYDVDWLAGGSGQTGWASPIWVNPTMRWSVEGAPLTPGQRYPLDYVTKPVVSGPVVE